MLTKEQEILIRDIVNATIGTYHYVEKAVRFNLARVMLRYYNLVIKGEDIHSPEAEALRERLSSVFRGIESVEGRVKSLVPR